LAREVAARDGSSAALLAECSPLEPQDLSLLQMRDYARLDYRLTDDGQLKFHRSQITIRSTPHAMGMNRCFVGIEHERLIARIVAIRAWRRYSK
jgi:hypothetical protein